METYQPSSQWMHYDDETFEVYDVLEITILLPEPLRNTRTQVLLLPNDLPTDSPLRRRGQVMEFGLEDPSAVEHDVEKPGAAE